MYSLEAVASKIYGQELAINYLQKAFENQKVAHAYLFAGKKGLGRKNLALAFAKAVYCAESRTFDDFCECNHCHKVDSKAHADLLIVGADETERSLKIQTIRELKSWVYLSPLESNSKVAIICGAERLTEEAANALLKVIEEPPKNTYLIFLAEEAFYLLGTIRSRIQEVKLRPLEPSNLKKILIDDFLYGMEEAQFLAFASGGSLGLSQEWQENGFYDNKKQIISSFVEDSKFFLQMDREPADKLDNTFFVLTLLLRDLLFYKHGLDDDSLINIDCLDTIELLGNSLSVDKIKSYLVLLESSRQQIKRNVNKKLILAKLACEIASSCVVTY